MEISFRTSSLQRRCPLCQDDLPSVSASWLRCGNCGTGYHPECKSLSPRCALLGCPGSLGVAGALVTPRFALVLEPRDYSPAQIQAVADRLELGAYDAALRLRSPLPSVLAYGTQAELAQHHAALTSAGVFTLAVDALGLSQGPLEVVSLDREGEALTLRSEDGRSHPLALSAPRLVVLGRYQDHEKILPTKRGKNSSVSRRVTRLRVSAEFVHVYPDEGPEPLALSADRIRDYRFLGVEMSVSGAENFQALKRLLCQGARVETLRELEGKLISSRKDSSVHRSSNRAWALTCSNLLRLVDWSSRQAKGSKDC